MDYPLSQNTVQHAASRLGNALRLHAESSVASKRLFAIDREEAIDNLDRSLDGVLEAMHSLFDAMKTAVPELKWWNHGDTGACLLVRNARHHNGLGLFESWNSKMQKRLEIRAKVGAQYMMVGYRSTNEASFVAEYYVPFDDFRLRLSKPDKFVRQEFSSVLDRDCAFASIRAYVAAETFPADQVYINLTPLFMNAATRVFQRLQAAGIAPTGTDIATYIEHFSAGPLADLQQPTWKTVTA